KEKYKDFKPASSAIPVLSRKPSALRLSISSAITADDDKSPIPPPPASPTPASPKALSPASQSRPVKNKKRSVD
ncbi:MAG: hypothetical protein ACHQVK_03645, partial [Candidatus Paceibacterales bacterium]